jgi:DNA repair exonuclease SbcCD nuclease subunit
VRSLRLVHTADVHIGDDLSPEERLAGLRAAVDVTLSLRADALLIAGDLFDSARVAARDLIAALEQLARLAVPVIVTNGNHDALLAPSVYERVRLSEAGPHVRFLDRPEGSHAVIEEIGLTVWARGMVDHHPGHNPLEGYSGLVEGHWQVAMAHGHYFPAREKPDRSSPVREEEIAALSCDYLALGHFHRFLDVSSNGTPAFYCGSPSEAGGSVASVNLVTLAPGVPVRVERIGLTP